MPSVIYVPSRIGEGHFTDFQSPAAGATDNGKIWAWNSATSKFEPIALPTTSPGGAIGQVQYHNGSGFGGHSGHTYNGAGIVTVSTALVSPDVRPASNAVNSTGFSAANGTRVLSVDTTSNRVGIGTTSPTALLEVNGIAKVNTYLSVTEIRMSGYSFARIGINTSDGGPFYGYNIKNVGGAYQHDSTGTIGACAFSSQGIFLYACASQASGSTATLAGRITTNGLMAIGAHSPTAFLHLPASTTFYASLRVPSGIAPTSPNSGDLWYDGTNIKFQDGATTRTLTWT